MSKHTPGPWMVADSNSWRRIVTQDLGRCVIVPIKQRDGQPDLLAEREDLELAARAPELLEELTDARDQLEQARKAINRAGALAMQGASHELIRQVLAEGIETTKGKGE